MYHKTSAKIVVREAIKGAQTWLSRLAAAVWLLLSFEDEQRKTNNWHPHHCQWDHFHQQIITLIMTWHDSSVSHSPEFPFFSIASSPSYSIASSPLFGGVYTSNPPLMQYLSSLMRIGEGVIMTSVTIQILKILEIFPPQSHQTPSLNLKELRGTLGK